MGKKAGLKKRAGFGWRDCRGGRGLDGGVGVFFWAGFFFWRGYGNPPNEDVMFYNKDLPLFDFHSHSLY